MTKKPATSKAKAFMVRLPTDDYAKLCEVAAYAQVEPARHARNVLTNAMAGRLVRVDPVKKRDKTNMAAELDGVIMDTVIAWIETNFPDCEDSLSEAHAYSIDDYVESVVGDLIAAKESANVKTALLDYERGKAKRATAKKKAK